LQNTYYKINEVFESIQGEGFWTGQFCLFIRFSGCNLQCSFCDTEHETFDTYKHDELLEKIKDSYCLHVILTGGEPTLQINKQFISDIVLLGKFIHIETNGTLPIPDGIHWVTVSPKTDDFVIRTGDELKLVYSETMNLKRLETTTFFDWYFIQPESCKNIDKVIEMIKDNGLWRLSLQTHKILNIH
jgi:organic radical activating enzyme